MNEAEQRLENGVRIITPRNLLREKIGYGGIDPVALERAEEIIQKNDVDFEPYARGYLSRIEQAVAVARASANPDREIINTIIRPIMELKANGGMFGYPLASEIADVILDFLETVDSLNEDALEIIDVHQKTLNAIIIGKLLGDGGKEGLRLSRELYGACKRYHKKHGTGKKD